MAKIKVNFVAMHIPKNDYDPARHRLPEALEAMKKGSMIYLRPLAHNFGASKARPEVFPMQPVDGILINDVEKGEGAKIIVHKMHPSGEIRLIVIVDQADAN